MFSADLQRARLKVTLKCDQDRTERIVAVAITIVVAEIEHACIRTIIVIASAHEERTARVRKDRVIAVPRTTARVTVRARLVYRISIFS